MKDFKSSLLAEKVAEYEHPTNVSDDDGSSSGESEEGTSSEEIDSEPKHSDSDSSDPGNDLSKGNAGWADAMSKILKTNKPKKKRTVVLSRAKKLSDVKASSENGKAVTFEIDGEIKREEDSVAPQSKSTLKDLPKVRRKDWESRGRIKPVYPDPDREKSLSKIAIKGVVQLFNAVQKHQTGLEQKLKSAGASEIKRERILKSVDKRAFLDVLMGNSRSEVIEGPVNTEHKTQLKKEEPQSSMWSVLRDDFMTDTTLKDWDKDTESGVNEARSGENVPQESLSSDDNDDVDMT